MNEINDLALAGLLHDIGKFGQRAEIELRSSIFSKQRYNYLHAAYSAQIMTDLFELDGTLIDYSAMHHNLKETDGSDEYWIVASADRLASGFEREVFENYNQNSEFEKISKEDFKTQRLRNIFDETKEYRIAPLGVENIFPANSKSTENEYIKAWKALENDLGKIDKGNRHTDLVTLEYLLKKHTSFMPSSTSFKKGEFAPVKANIPLYDHLKTTAIFAGVLGSKLMPREHLQNVLSYYKGQKSDMEQNDFYLIAGDFFGIQNFIFDNVEAKHASKTLRAKSAYIQILTKILALALCEKLELSSLCIISDSAGKFEILAPKSDKVKEQIEAFQKEINRHFKSLFFAQTGVGVSFVACGLADFIGVEDRNYQALRKKLSLSVESAKFKKFDLTNEADFVLDIDEGLDNKSLCPLCKKRKKEGEYCKSCQSFVTIGQKLSKDNFLAITKDQTAIPIFGDFHIKFIDDAKVYKNSVAIYDLANKNEFRGYAKWELGSYVAKDNDEIVTFDKLAKNSVPEGLKDGKREHGVEALMALKGDVDGMGDFIKKSSVTNSFAKFNFFSRMVDYYFSVYVPHLMATKYPNTYTVFAGGDDVLIIGAWDEMIGLAKEIRSEFMRFAEGSSLTISKGMVMFKHSKPINFIAHLSEEALEKAKEMDDKDAVSLFGETVKWDDYLDDLGLKEELENIDDIKTAFLYRLLDFVAMSKKVKYENDILSTIWKSKLNYSFSRNMDKNNQSLLTVVDKMIEEYPKEAKMHLSEFIYKRRD